MLGITFTTMTCRMTGTRITDPGTRESPTSTLYLRSCKELNVTPDNSILSCLRTGASKLDLSGKWFTHKELYALCAALMNDTTVISLLLPNNGLDDEDALLIADLLEQNRTLQEIDLMSNDIHYTGACALLSSLKDRPERFILCLSSLNDSVRIQACALLCKNYRAQHGLPEHSIILINY